MPIGTQHWIQQDMLSDLSELHDSGGRAAGVRFRIRNRFFHAGRPLGFFRRFAVEVDGKAAAPELTTLIIRGQRFTADAVPTLADVWWQALEDIEVEVADPEVRSAAEHAIVIDLELPLVVFTPILDRDGVYPSNPARLETVLPTTAHRRPTNA